MAEPGGGDATTVEALTRELALANAAASNAYRDTTRLIRVLDVLGRQLSPEELVDQTLTVLSEVFFADVTCVARAANDRLLVTGSCGLPEDDVAFTEGWPEGDAAVRARATGVVVTRSNGVDDRDGPGFLRGLDIRSAAWVPLSTDADVSDLLILFRRRDEPFGQSDLEVLSSAAHRLALALRDRERTAVIERLARYGHLLAEHLELEPLLDAAVDLLRRLTTADSAWVVTLDTDGARLRAHRGLSDEALAEWPRSRSAVGDTHAALNARPPLLRLPISGEGGIVAMLYAARDRPQPFADDVLETTTIFANHLGVAMANSELYRALGRRATHDPLTGLANRGLVGQRLDAELVRPSPSRVGLLFCDLDKFKDVNDRLGHEAGDELLQEVGWRLRRCLRPGDLLGRFGGDEFVILVDAVRELDEVAAVGRRVSQALEEPFTLYGERVQVSVSIGGVVGIRGQTTASDMLRDADAAMYVAKERGPGLVEVFDDRASQRSRDRLALRSELSHALDRHQLAVRYQPVYTLATGQLVGFEALLRWTLPGRGQVPPDVFIPLAEETGAIVAIGRWVLDQACRQLAQWQRVSGIRRLAMSVNVSAAQLHQPHVAAETLAVIRASGVDPADVWLEVAEHSYVRDDVTDYATTLQTAGVHFALDDFGTAYSNLGNLKRFPVDVLKIDRSFVSRMTDRDIDRRIVDAIVAIAHSLGLSTVAEGVETVEQRDALIALGCRLGQGNLMSEPLSPTAATALLHANR